MERLCSLVRARWCNFTLPVSAVGCDCDQTLMRIWQSSLTMSRIVEQVRYNKIIGNEGSLLKHVLHWTFLQVTAHNVNISPLGSDFLAIASNLEVELSRKIKSTVQVFRINLKMIRCPLSQI